jgi:hypothetical protein
LNGDDTVSGGAGDDELRGGRGYNVLTGGAGSDDCSNAPGTGESYECETTALGALAADSAGDTDPAATEETLAPAESSESEGGSAQPVRGRKPGAGDG